MSSWQYYGLIGKEILGSSQLDWIWCSSNIASSKHSIDNGVSEIKKSLRNHPWCQKVVKKDIDDISFFKEHRRSLEGIPASHRGFYGISVSWCDSAGRYVASCQ